MEVHEVTLPVTGTPEGAARARRTLMNEVSGWRRSAVTDDLHGAETVAGELLANAVRHGGPGTASITARLRGDRLRFEVRDQSSAVPRKCAVHPEAEHGRGLLIIAALADEHGVERGSSGKSCWAEFDLAAPPGPPHGLRPPQSSRPKELIVALTRASASNAEVIAVRPGSPLVGSVIVDGSKNAALPLLATAAAVRRNVQLENVPASADVQAMVALLHGTGWHVAQAVGRPDTLLVMAPEHPSAAPDLSGASAIRASYYLVPALLALRGSARLPWPGGCRIGQRGMELHFKVYEAFGDHVTVRDAGYAVEAGGQGSGGTVSHALPFRSRGATIAAVLRAVVADRALRLGLPNLSPEVLAVLDALRSVGWQAKVNDRVLALDPASTPTDKIPAWRVPGDKIEAGTLACAVAATGGKARIDGIHGRDLVLFQATLQQLGIPTSVRDETLLVDASNANPTGRPLRAIATLAPRGLDADFEPPLMALALGRPGTHLFADSINPGRHGNLLPQLARLGADIEEISPTECRLTGPQRLTGAGVEATDIRTGSALMVAALTARGITTLGGVDQLRRGHADLPGKLLQLGADICEVAP